MPSATVASQYTRMVNCPSIAFLSEIGREIRLVDRATVGGIASSCDDTGLKRCHTDEAVADLKPKIKDGLSRRMTDDLHPTWWRRYGGSSCLRVIASSDCNTTRREGIHIGHGFDPSAHVPRLLYIAVGAKAAVVGGISVHADATCGVVAA